MSARAVHPGKRAVAGLRSVTSFSPQAAAPNARGRHGVRAAGAQVLMAVVKVSRFPNGSATVMSRVPQGMAFTLGRACL